MVGLRNGMINSMEGANVAMVATSFDFLAG